MERNDRWLGRNPLLVLTAALLAATLQVALPNLHV